MKYKMLWLAAAALTVSAGAQAKQKACIFDLAMTSGPVYAAMRDYAIQAQKWGADLELTVSSNEDVLYNDFLNGKCDLLASTGIRVMPLNKFVGTFNAIGAIPNPKVARSVVQLLSSPKFDTNMVNGKYEIAGITPVGSVYMFNRDRTIDTLVKAKGKKIAVLANDDVQDQMVAKVGLQAVPTQIGQIGKVFNNGVVDLVALPAVAFKPLELHKGLGTKGGVAPVPVIHLSGTITINTTKFPAGYGVKSRQWVGTQVDKALAEAKKAEGQIPANYWMKIPAVDILGYDKLMREARIDLSKRGYYDPKMTALLKKVRCSVDPTGYECSLAGE